MRMKAWMAQADVPLLEVWGVRYLERRWAREPGVRHPDAVHILNPDEQVALRRIERRTVLRAGIAGALSAGVAAVAELVARGTDDAGLSRGGFIWVVAATLLATTLEVAYLYRDALRAVHELARAAGVDLFPPGSNGPRFTAAALARAALELPNRPDPELGVDPYKDTSRLGLAAAAVIYKLKVGLTSYALKLIGRLAGRTLARAWLPLVALPVTAVWNAWVAGRVVREARIRAMGPSAAREQVDAMLGAEQSRPRDLSPRARTAALRAVGCVVVGKGDLHPNLAILLVMVRDRVGASEGSIDDRQALLADLPALADDEQHLVLDLLALALVLDGRLTRRELALWRQARAACGLSPDPRPLSALREAFLQGTSLRGATATVSPRDLSGSAPVNSAS